MKIIRFIYIFIYAEGTPLSQMFGQVHFQQKGRLVMFYYYHVSQSAIFYMAYDQSVHCFPMSLICESMHKSVVFLYATM